MEKRNLTVSNTLALTVVCTVTELLLMLHVLHIHVYLFHLDSPTKRSNKITFKEKLERGTDFLRFCNTQNYNINGRLREQLKHFYETDYKTYRQQLHPHQQFISFALVIKALYIVRNLHNRGDKIYFGGHPQNQNRPQSRQLASPPPPPRQGTPDGGTGNNKSRRRRRDRTHRSKLAVDQHIIFNKAESDQEEIGEPQGADLRSGGFSQDSPTTAQSCPYPYVKRAGNIFTCIPCSARCTSEAELKRHVQGRRHRLGVLTHELRIKRYDNACVFSFKFIPTKMHTHSARVREREKENSLSCIHVYA